MRRLLALALLPLTACLGSGPAAKVCNPKDYAAAVAAAYAPHVTECAEFDGSVEDCPGYQQARADVEKLHKEFVACQ